MMTLPDYVTQYKEDFINLHTRYDGIEDYVKEMCEGNIRSLIITGPAGVGKSYSVGQYLKKYATGNVKVIKGHMTNLKLYQHLYAYRNVGDVLVLDDIDSVYESIEGLNLLKAAMDTDATRHVSWESNTNLLSAAGIPLSFVFEGSVVLISNTGFNGKFNKKQQAHLKALVDRTYSIQVAADGIDNCFKQVCYMVIVRDMLRSYGFSNFEKSMLLSFLEMHKISLTTMSLRTLTKVADIYTMKKGGEWRKMALQGLLKGE